MSGTFDSAQAREFDEDLRFIEQFVAGHPGAFQRIYEKYYDRTFQIARGILMDSEEAADTVQEIFTLVYRNLPRFDRRSKFSTWLYRVAVNRSIQQARSNRGRSRLVSLSEAQDAAIPFTEPTIQDPRIQSAMRELSPQDRALLTLFYWEELSLREIADSIGLNPNAAKTRLFRARERFKQIYERSER